MRTLQQNKQIIKYANYLGSVPEYALDENGNKIVDFVDDDGNIFYVFTGENIVSYSDPEEAKVNISFGGGDIQPAEFGIDTTAYDATLLFLLNEFPITETSLVWYKTDPVFIGEGDDRHVDPKSADYRVLSVKPSLNYTKVLLGKTVK